MSFGAIAGGALALGGSLASANSASKAAEATNAANAKIAGEANRLNYQMWQESRDSVLPNYAKDSEAGIYGDILSLYKDQAAGYDAAAILSQYNLASAYDTYKRNAEVEASKMSNLMLNALPDATRAKVSAAIGDGATVSDVIALGVSGGYGLNQAEINQLATLETRYGAPAVMSPHEWLTQYAAQNPNTAVAEAVNQSSTTLTDRAIAELSKAVSGSNQITTDLLTGATGDARMAMYDDVAKARLAGAGDVNAAVLSGAEDISLARISGLDAASRARTAGINTGLQESLGNLNAARAASGLTGGSSYANNLAQGATIRARQDAAYQTAAERSAAELANAQEMAAARQSAAELTASVGESNAAGKLTTSDENLANQLANINQPYAGITNAASAQQAQTASNYSNVNELLNSLGFFNIGTSQAESATTPTYDTVPGSGQAAGAAISSLGSTVMDYAMANKAMQAQNAASRQGTSLTSASTKSFLGK